MRKRLSRRHFLGAGAGVLAAAGGLAWLYQPRKIGAPLGDLISDSNGMLDLPPGFSYQVLQRVGDQMTDGFNVPGAPDAMACFAGDDDSWVVMRNHEIHEGSPVDPTLGFADNRGGGVTRLVVDRESGALQSSNFVLTGTSRNCAGGPSPYGWLSCEEVGEPGHGYVFLCDASASTLQAPHKLPALGRFPHEAAAFDEATGITYLTEDTSDSAIYRHLPDHPTKPFVGGELQALKVSSTDRFRLSEGPKVGDAFDVEWVSVADPQALKASTRDQAHNMGAAFLSRGEGAWFAEGHVYICSTDGGPNRRGQLYRLDILSDGMDRLTLVAQAESEDSFANPDNITVSPWGDVFLAEDGAAPNGVRVLKPDGSLHHFARNALNGGKSEIAGICFSPDGKWLFLNLQWEGLTLAITGPFTV
jgi:secreted PhoX family phosphatase